MENRKLLVISSRAPLQSAVVEAAKSNVSTVCYKYETHTLHDILVEVNKTLGQKKAESIGLLMHCSDTQIFVCFNDRKVINTESVKKDAGIRDFLTRLSSSLDVSSSKSRIDFLNTAQLSSSLLCQYLELMLKTRFEAVFPLLQCCNSVSVAFQYCRGNSTSKRVCNKYCTVTFSHDLTGSVVDNNCDSVVEEYFDVIKLRDLLQSQGHSGHHEGVLDGYEKIRTVGKGAFGTAVLYKRLADEALVVIKETNMIDLSAAERQMALNEVQVLSSLNHPNIISYLGSFENDGVLMIEMEYADGGTLAQLVSQRARLSEREILTLFQQIVAAIQHMHQNNILHRDLKTANVFLTKERKIKVGDFGISKMMTTKGQAQTVLGTPYYISPEICEGKQYDQKSDIWALGCILYELASLHKTFEGSNLPVLVNKIIKGTFEPLPIEYSEGFRNLVSDLLQKDPTQRPTAAEVYERTSLLFNQATDDEEFLSDSQNNGTSYRSCKQERSVLYQLSGRGENFSLVPIHFPVRCKITQVAVSNTHYVAVTADMLVYTWGEGKRGQLGHNEISTWKEKPKLVDALSGRNICKIGAGDGFSVFVSDSGMVMTCGDGTFGCLGHGDWNNVTKPKLIESLLSVDVSNISCGEHHCAILSGDGNLFTWGRGDGGRLGLGHEHDCCEPTAVALPTQERPMSVYCGVDSTAVITARGLVYVCGRNTHNKLGISYSMFQSLGIQGKKIEKTLTMTKVKSLNGWKIKSVSMSLNHSAALTECGCVITMGSNNEAQLGHTKPYPFCVKAMEDKTANMVVCGPTYTVVGSDENAIYCWGTQYSPHCTQVYESSSNSTASTTSLVTEVTAEPQEILALYASPNHVSRGETIVLAELNTLWHSILVLVHTTVPMAKQGQISIQQYEYGPSKLPPTDGAEFDSIGPIPDWIKEELSQSENPWLQDLPYSTTLTKGVN